MSHIGAIDAYNRGEITYEEARDFEADWRDEYRGEEDEDGG